MTYELAKQLKEAGWVFKKEPPLLQENNFTPPEEREKGVNYDSLWFYTPTLSELIEACGNGPEGFLMWKSDKLWGASFNRFEKEVTVSFWGNPIELINQMRLSPEDLSPMGEGKTPEEAVANLWLELNKGRNKY